MRGNAYWQSGLHLWEGGCMIAWMHGCMMTGYILCAPCQTERSRSLRAGGSLNLRLVDCLVPGCLLLVAGCWLLIAG